MQEARLKDFVDFFLANADNSTDSDTTTSSDNSTSAIVDIKTTQVPITSAQATAISSVSNASPTAPAATNSPNPTTSSVQREASATSNAKDLAVGALGDNDSTSSADYNDLIRNSYIIIGLLALVILLLIGVVVATMMRKMAPSGKNHKYKAIIPPVDEREVYSGPSGRYSD